MTSTQMTARPEPLYTTTEVADLLQISLDTVQSLCNKGRINAVRFGSAVRFAPAEIKRLYAEGAVSPK